MKHCFTFLLLAFISNSLGQTIPDSLKYYKEDATEIDSSQLDIKVIPWEVLMDEMHGYDHGVEIKLYTQAGVLRKAELWYGMSRGPFINTIYFKDNMPFYVYEIQLQFAFDATTHEFDYDKPMDTVSTVELYFYDWEETKYFYTYYSPYPPPKMEVEFEANDYKFEVELIMKYVKE